MNRTSFIHAQKLKRVPFCAFRALGIRHTADIHYVALTTTFFAFKHFFFHISICSFMRLICSSKYSSRVMPRAIQIPFKDLLDNCVSQSLCSSDIGSCSLPACIFAWHSAHTGNKLSNSNLVIGFALRIM